MRLKKSLSLHVHVQFVGDPIITVADPLYEIPIYGFIVVY